MSKIAVVGMAGVFPQALNTEQFLDNIIHKRDAVVTVPASRWIDPVADFISKKSLPDTAVSKKAGIIEGFHFDPDGFQVAKDLLSELDPLHHLVLQAGRDAFSQCLHTRETRKRTGVILAAIALPTDSSSRFSWQLLCDKTYAGPGPKDFSSASAVSLPAALLSRALGLEGGSFTLDAACASSLYSIKLACEHLQLKKADIMLAGGVSRPDSLYTQIGFTQLQALSPSGRCSPFDRSADGLVVGEGAGIIVLKRLEDAIDCGDNIHCVITGAGVSNDIEGTLVGPASEGQVRAMIQAYEQASWSPSDIQYMECHGSGTPVGDQVELSSIHALRNTFGCSDRKLAIGSVKSMTGHLLTAAGITGFIKTVLSMNKGFLPPSLNYSQPSPNSLLNDSHVSVQTQVEDWKPETTRSTRKAGISAFGFGGINAHLLVEAFKPQSKKQITRKRIKKQSLKNVPCAIIGMETIAKDCPSLKQFKDLVFGRSRLNSAPPGDRWRRQPPPSIAEKPGFYLDQFTSRVGEFHIPPNQMADILPQHVLLLKAAKGALEDAGIPPRPAGEALPRHHIGCAVGIDFDYGATDFHLRWKINPLDKTLKAAISPPLTFNRTLGALGGIVASRVAREFKLGGPCFTLSAGGASGIKAVETGIHSLSSGETDVFLCGGVDLAGDIRQFALTDIAKARSDKILPSEGAAAIVLKRLDQAIEDNDRIYGIITGVAGTSGGCIPGEKSQGLKPSEALYARSLENALKESKARFNDIGLYETCSSGVTEDDRIEKTVLETLCLKNQDHGPCHFTAATSIIGNTGSASSLFSIVQAALCLHHTSLPSRLSMVPVFKQSIQDQDLSAPIPFVWKEPDTGTIRKACVASITLDGSYSHLILEEQKPKNKLPQDISFSGKAPSESVDRAQSKTDIVLKTNPRPISEKTLLEIQEQAGMNHGPGSPSAPEIPGNLSADPERKTNLKNIAGLENAGLDPALISKGTHATASAHEKFLAFSTENMQHLEKQFKTLTRLAGQVMQSPEGQTVLSGEPPVPDQETIATGIDIPKQTPPAAPFLDRDQCLEYATGKAGNVLGKEFEIIDTYPVRVRLPDEPLMLVDRIMQIQGEKLSLTSGKIITQHDVKENAWYLDGGKAPVSISIEAGQADLFLCAWLGIDHVIKGTRKYRLLDARVTFHRTLPEPGETIEYHIEIDRFLKQGEVYLFFFHYKGYINDQLLISMRDGCAGFFTEQEVENSGGIILKAEDTRPIKPESNFSPLVPVKKESFSDEKIDALRSGNLGRAFGEDFRQITLGKGLNLPGKRMRLVDRVLEFNPAGGRFGLGSIIAQADIHPDDWFLTCHFIDDRVMPGTLMYDCCAHALRIFTQRMGWVSDRDDVFYDVLPDNESDLKCRGPVTPDTQKARYEIEIKEMGYAPEPYVIADAHMFSDELRIVLYKNMGMKLAGVTKTDLESFWRRQ